MSSYTEDHLVELPAIQLMQHEMGWDVMNGFGEWVGEVSDLGREGKREMVLTGRLGAALLALNPNLVGFMDYGLFREGHKPVWVGGGWVEVPGSSAVHPSKPGLWGQSYSRTW